MEEKQNNPAADQNQPQAQAQNQQAAQPQAQTASVAPATPAPQANQPAAQRQQKPQSSPAQQNQAPQQQQQTEQQAQTPTQKQESTPAKPAPKGIKFPEVNIAEWNEKEVSLTKTFYTTKAMFSPRAFYKPISMPGDLIRARQAVEKAGYQVGDTSLVLDTGDKFLSTLMVEVPSVDPEKKDPNLVKFQAEKFYAKVLDDPGKVGKTKTALEKQLGKKITELYVMHVVDAADKKTKQILLAG